MKCYYCGCSDNESPLVAALKRQTYELIYICLNHNSNPFRVGVIDALTGIECVMSPDMPIGDKVDVIHFDVISLSWGDIENVTEKINRKYKGLLHTCQ